MLMSIKIYTKHRKKRTTNMFSLLTRRSAFVSMIILVYVMSIAYLPVKISDVKLD